MKFRRIPQEIEAFQMTREARQDNSNWPAWLGEAWQKEPGEAGALWPGDWPNSDGCDELYLEEGHGTTVVAFGNWILNIDGDLSVMHNRVFVRLYEHIMPADEDDVSPELLAEMRAWMDVISAISHDIAPNAERWAAFLEPVAEFMHHKYDQAALERRILAGSGPLLALIIKAIAEERFGEPWVDLWCETDAELMMGMPA